MSAYSTLLSPISLGPVILTNRAVVSGHTMRMGDGNVGVSNRLRRYLVERAHGGAGLITLESSPIHETSRNPSNPIELFRDEVVPSLGATADAIHKAGSKLSIILWHGGHNVGHRGSGIAAVAPSAVPSISAWDTPRVLRADEIPEIIRAYGSAAKRCLEAGLDAVEVQTSTDYLLGSFLSPRLNHRTDSYGGSPENRIRIVKEVLEEIRHTTANKLAIGLRTSIAHHIPHDPEDYDIDESLDLMSRLAETELLDWISVMSGSHWSMDRAIPLMEAPRAVLAQEAAKFREKTGVPIMVAGRIRSPEEAELMLTSEQTDLVAMARTWIAEPHWIRKIVSGKVSRIRPCMTCNQGCIGFVTRGLPGTCVTNPAAGREEDLPDPEPTSQPKKITVVGAGPAGLEFSRIAAMRGHMITLCDESVELGGAMRLASKCPSREEISLPLAWWASELERLGITFALGQRQDGNDESADLTVWAVGATPDQSGNLRQRPYLIGGIPGTESAVFGRHVIANKDSVSGRVLVIDEEGGWPAVAISEYISCLDSVLDATLISSASAPGMPEAGFTYETRAVARRLRDAGINVFSNAIVDRMENGAAQLLDGRSIGQFESVVLVTGNKPNAIPEDALAIGDCVAPRGMWAAVHDAAQLARRI